MDPDVDVAIPRDYLADLLDDCEQNGMNVTHVREKYLPKPVPEPVHRGAIYIDDSGVSWVKVAVDGNPQPWFSYHQNRLANWDEIDSPRVSDDDPIVAERERILHAVSMLTFSSNGESLVGRDDLVAAVRGGKP